jgi:hypothetical protein
MTSSHSDECSVSSQAAGRAGGRSSPLRGVDKTLVRITAEYRNQIIQELIEKIGPKASVYSYSRTGGMELEWDYSVADWLKSQMEKDDE